MLKILQIIAQLLKLLKSEKMKLHQQLEETLVAGDNESLVTLPAKKDSSSSQYCDLEQKLIMDLPLYQPLFVNDIAPVDHLKRRQWLSGISFPFPIVLYKYPNAIVLEH